MRRLAMTRLHFIALLIIVAATASAAAQGTRLVRVSLNCVPDHANLVIGDEQLAVPLDKKVEKKGTYWRGPWNGPLPLADGAVGSLRLFGHRTFARSGLVVSDAEVNDNVLSFTFPCSSAEVKNLQITPSPSIPFSYCRRMGRDPSAPNETRNLVEWAASSESRPISDWKYPDEKVRLLLYSSNANCKTDLGLELNDLVKNKKLGTLTKAQLNEARCLELAKGKASPPTLFCLKDEEHLADLKLSLELK
jgi:hypothetical protein